MAQLKQKTMLFHLYEALSSDDLNILSQVL